MKGDFMKIHHTSAVDPDTALRADVNDWTPEIDDEGVSIYSASWCLHFTLEEFLRIATLVKEETTQAS